MALAATWIMGAAICLLRLVASAIWLWSLRTRQLSPLECAQTLTASAYDQLKRQSATVLLVDREIMPMAVGIWNRQIVLPQSVLAIAPNDRDAIVMQELGHLSRRDPLWHLLAECSRALFWFHPLQWILVRSCAVNREQACDDLVLRGGFAPDHYARGLLHAVAKYCASRRQCVGVAMAAPKQTENRIRDVMNPAQNRHPLSRSFAVAMAAVVFSSCIALSVVRAANPPDALATEKPVAEPKITTKPIAAKQDATQQPTSKQPATLPPIETNPTETPTPTTEKVTASFDGPTLSGRILNSVGMPVARAKILHNWFDDGKTQTLEKTSNHLGEFSITYPLQKGTFQLYTTWISGGVDPIETLAFSPHFGESNSITNADIRLPKSDPVTVRVVTPNGVPFEGAMVYPGSVDIRRMRQTANGMEMENTPMFSTSLPKSLIESLSVATNSNGEATLPQFQDESLVGVIVRSFGYGQQHFDIRNANRDLQLSAVGSIRGKVLYDHPDQITGQTVHLKGRRLRPGGNGAADVKAIRSQEKPLRFTMVRSVDLRRPPRARMDGSPPKSRLSANETQSRRPLLPSKMGCGWILRYNRPQH